MWSVYCGPRGIKSNYAIYGRKGNYRIGIKVHSGSCGSCEIYAAFVLIKFLSLRINSETQKNKKENSRERGGEMSRETKHVRINLKTDDGARKTKTKTNSEPKQLYAIYAVVMKGGAGRMGEAAQSPQGAQPPTHGNTNKLRAR